MICAHKLGSDRKDYLSTVTREVERKLNVEPGFSDFCCFYHKTTLSSRMKSKTNFISPSKSKTLPQKKLHRIYQKSALNK